MESASLDSTLKEIRLAANKTVPEVSKYLTSLGHKASEKTVYSWESGRSRPTIDIFLDMCKFYGVTDVLSYFGGDPTETKKFPSTAEAAPGMRDNDFGRTLRMLRTSSGKTVPEVSEYLTSLGYKAATQTIYGWERGLSQPNPTLLLAMCDLYGVDDILSAFGYKETPSTAEAAPGEDDLKLMEYLKRAVYDMGFLPEGADLTDRQADALLGVCAILHAIFDE